MLHLYDINHNKIKGLKKYRDYRIESVLSTGDKTLLFSYPLHLAKDIVEECYIRNKDNEFVVKEINDGEEDWVNIVATLNVENLEGKAWKSFESKEQTIADCLNLAFAGTGWIVKSSTVTKKRTIRMTNVSSWAIIQQALRTYRCEIKLDSINKEVLIFEKLGEDKGVYFSDSLNLVSLNKQGNTYDFYTKMIALGKTTSTENEDGTTTESTLEVTVENHQYSNKVKTIIWKDERYTDEASLREDAYYKLDEMSKPYNSYIVDVLDLANINIKYKNILDYSIGDTITILSKSREFKDKQRIVKLIEYPDEPYKNNCELGNIRLTFDQVQKEHQEVSDTVNNITSDNGTISDSAIKYALLNCGGSINKDEINAIKISVGKLEATVAEINTAYIDKAYIDELIVKYATIENLEAALAKIGVLEVDYATIKELLAGHITSGNIQVGSITGDSLNMNTIFVKDANILDLSAAKIQSGTLDTSKVTIQSENGNILIADATQQFKDENGVVRIQIGEDAQGRFNFLLFDETGNGVLIDHTGIHPGAIADGMIKDEMIGDGAVGGKKINWSSFVSEFNKDTNTNYLMSTKIMVDGTNQTVNFHLNKLQEQISTLEGMDGDVSGVIETVSSHTTQLNMQKGQIDTLIQDTTIVKDGQTIKLKDEYNKTVNTVNSHTSTIASHSSQLNQLDGSIKSVDSKVNEVKRDLDGTKSTVSETSTKVGELNTKVSSHSSEISQMKDEISLKASQSDINTSLEPVTQELSQFKTDTNKDIGDVSYKVDTLRTDINTTIKDGIVTEAEGITIKNSINALNTEKADLDKRYNTIYANVNLKGATKTALKIAYDSYVSKHSVLINQINSMISDKVITADERKTYSTNITEYSKALANLSEAFDNAIYNISINEAVNKDREVITEVKSYTDSAITIAKNEINLGVSQVYETKTEVINKVNTSKNEAINSANTSTDNKLKSYSTTTQMNSAIQLKADSITSTVSQTYTTKNEFGNTTNNMQTQITQNANSIKEKVDAGYVSQEITKSAEATIFKFSNSGGKNLIKDGQFKSFEWNNGKWWWFDNNLSIWGRQDGKRGEGVGIYSTDNTRARLYSNYLTLKSNTVYTLNIDIIKESNVNWDNITIEFKNSSDQVIGTHDISKNGYTFTTPTNCSNGYIIITHGGRSSNVGGFVLWINNVALFEGAIQLPYSPHSDEIYDGNTRIDATGVAITNGALTIKNNKGQDVLKGDSSGNLNMNIWDSKLTLSATGDRKTQMWCDYYDKFILEVPYTQEGSGLWIKRSTGATILTDTARTDNPYYKVWMPEVHLDAIRTPKLYVTGEKNCLQSTTNYGERLINAYETCDYYFGDIGSGKIVNGECIVLIDDIFQECVNTNIQYHVFTQVYNGNITSIERYTTYFIVKGIDGTEFSWELKAKRIGYENNRLNVPTDIEMADNFDYHMTLDQETYNDKDKLIELEKALSESENTNVNNVIINVLLENENLENILLGGM